VRRTFPPGNRLARRAAAAILGAEEEPLTDAVQIYGKDT
jgi:hypothetical protein